MFNVTFGQRQEIGLLLLLYAKVASFPENPGS
jgi:hypothetical protein